MEITHYPGSNGKYIMSLNEKEMSSMRTKVDTVVKNIVSHDDVPDDIFSDIFGIKDPQKIPQFKRKLLENDPETVDMAIRSIIATNLRFTLFRFTEKDVTTQ